VLPVDGVLRKCLSMSQEWRVYMKIYVRIGKIEKEKSRHCTGQIADAHLKGPLLMPGLE
jgi:hypothetical protein